MGLAGKEDWDIVDWWPASEQRIKARQIEREVREWFVRLGGPFLLFPDLELEARRSGGLNGLSEVVCIDVEKFNGVVPFRSVSQWKNSETPEFIENIGKVVKGNNRKWLELVGA